VLVTNSVAECALLVILRVHLQIVNYSLKVDILASILTLLIDMDEMHMQKPERGKVMEEAPDFVLRQSILLLNGLVAICEN